MGLEDLKEKRHNPPIRWFMALGRKDTGIRRVVTNTQFTGLADGKVGYQYNQWCHYTDNPTSPDEPPERVERATRIITEAETFILKVTGFSPQEVSEMAHKLQKQHRNKKKSPIETELF